MRYNEFLGNIVSRLGFGAMRLPMNDQTAKIDFEEARKMILQAHENGVNYFDTAFSYQNGESELVIGRVLNELPRESWYIASKMPGHEINPEFDPKLIFEEQLRKCQVDYFDYYLLHNVYENSLSVYEDEDIGVLKYVLEQKQLGRIRHLGFSTHARFETLKKFLDRYGDNFEFVQIQLNYLDWDLQSAREKYELLTARGLEVVVMEPCRGGKLAKLDAAFESRLKEKRPEESVASWAFRFVETLDNVKVILSGMSTMEQVVDNVKTFSEGRLLDGAEFALLEKIATQMTSFIPCTGCRYCCKGCPQELNIPLLLNLYNDVKVQPTMTARMTIDSLPIGERPSECIGCGKCAQVCPQGINIPTLFREFADVLATIPSWEDVSRQRALQTTKIRDRKN